MYKKISFFIAALFIGLSAFAQQTSTGNCLVNLVPAPVNDTVHCGDTVTVIADGNSTQIQLTETFNNGAFSTGWQGTAGVTFTNPCGPGPGGATDPHMWMGTGLAGNRTVTTVDFDLTCGGFICFDLRLEQQGGGAPCEGPDQANEGVYLQYSNNNGATWNTIYYVNPDTNNSGGGTSSPLINWNTFCFNIPPAAQTTNTQIRWHQINTSGSNFDHWGLDNVEIATTCGTGYTYNWFSIDSTTVPPTINYQFQDTGDTSILDTVLYDDLTYMVMFFNNVDTCYDTLNINVLPSPIEAILSDPQICNTGDTAQVTVSGGNIYTWNVLNGDPINVGNNIGCNNCDDTWLSPSVTTTYQIGSDLTGICHEYDTITLETVAIFDAGFSFNDPVCVNGDTLVGTPIVSGGVFSGTGIIDSINGVFDPTLTAPGGNIPVTYTIPGACGNDSTINVDVTELPDATITSPSELCLTGGPFTLTSVVPGGTWSGLGVTDAAAGTYDPSIASSGTYTVTYTLNTPCFNQDTMQIRHILPFDVEIDPVTATICDSDTAVSLSFTLTTGANAGSQPYDVTWSGPGIVDPINGVFNPSLVGAGTHTISVSVSKPGGFCEGTDTYTITVFAPSDASFDVPVYCDNVTVNQPILPATPGIGNWTVNPLGSTTATFNPNNLVPAVIGAGTWELTYELVDFNGCFNSYTDTLRIAETPAAPTIEPVNFCAGDDLILAVNATNSDSVIWYDAATTNRPADSVATGSIVDFGIAQDPNLTGPITYYVTQSNFGCESEPLEYIIPIQPSPKADFFVTYTDTMGNEQTVPSGTPATGYAPFAVQFSVAEPQPNQGYIWSFWLGCNGSVVNNSGCPCPPINGFDTLMDGSFDPQTIRPVDSYTYGCEGFYPAALIVENEFGCRDTTTSPIEVLGSEQIPNVFSPRNKDGINDYFQVVRTGLVDYKLTIYNRWGREMYTQTRSCTSGEPNCGWDGTANGSEVSTGIYFWVLEGTTISGASVKENGTVTLVE